MQLRLAFPFLVWAALLGGMLMLSGCAGDVALKTAVVEANIQSARERAKPIRLLDASIPTPAGLMTIVVNTPSTGVDTQVHLPGDPMAEALRDGVRVLGTMGNMYLGGRAAVGLAQVVGEVASRPPVVVHDTSTTETVRVVDPVVVPAQVVTPLVVPTQVVQPVVVPVSDVVGP